MMEGVEQLFETQRWKVHKGNGSDHHLWIFVCETTINFYLVLATKLWNFLACNEYSQINSIKVTFYSTIITKEDNFKQFECNKDIFRKEIH